MQFSAKKRCVSIYICNFVFDFFNVFYLLIIRTNCIGKAVYCGDTTLVHNARNIVEGGEGAYCLFIYILLL